jgi:hypothetical protein
MRMKVARALHKQNPVTNILNKQGGPLGASPWNVVATIESLVGYRRVF